MIFTNYAYRSPRVAARPRHSRQQHNVWVSITLLCLLASTSLTHAWGGSDSPKSDVRLKSIPVWPHKIAKHADHNSEYFTQGLVVGRDSVIVSSGLYGRSFVQRNTRQDGAEEARFTLPDHLFAEGIAQYGQQLYLLTWKSEQGFILDTQSLRPLKGFRFQGQGWGITRVGKRLLMSNGSAELSWYRPDDFTLLEKTTVLAGQQPIDKINALSYGGGYLWANVWKQDTILAIDPYTGQIKGRLKLDKLWQQQVRGNKENVLNGLSWDESEQALWVTGKRWKQRYLLDIQRPLPITQETHIR